MQSALTILTSSASLWILKRIIIVALLTWIGLSVAQIILAWLPKPKLKVAQPISDVRAFDPNLGDQRPRVDIETLKALALFGDESVVTPESTLEPEPILTAPVEETRLNLELVGSFANSDPTQAYAIIAKGKQQALYRVNESVSGLNGVKLVRVFSDRVLLDNQGRQESLLMYPENPQLSSSSPSDSISPELSALEEPEEKTEGPISLESVLPEREIAANLQKISDVIRFSRKTENGKMLGFRVLPGRNRQAFEQSGLQLNDVITAIDGQSLDNLRTANAIYQEKRNAMQARLTVLRGEETLTVDIDLETMDLSQ